MKKELEDFPKEKLSKLNDYFDGEERPYSLQLIGELKDVIFVDRDERKKEND